MMVDYSEVRDQMLPGDLIAFGGKGRASSIIKRFTRSVVSHVGLVRHVQMLGAYNTSRYFNEIIESTSLDGVSGVQAARLSKRLEQYEGEAWWLPLTNEARKRFDETAFWNWLYEQEGKPYDIPQAILAGLDWLDEFGGVTVATEDFSALFCSELAAGALRAAGVLDTRSLDNGLRMINASEETPIQLCQRPIWKSPVQLKGKPMRIYDA